MEEDPVKLIMTPRQEDESEPLIWEDEERVLMIWDPQDEVSEPKLRGSRKKKPEPKPEPKPIIRDTQKEETEPVIGDMEEKEPEQTTRKIKREGPVQIIESLPNHKFALNEEALNELLLQDDIKDRDVVVISVAGAFRKGKSFLLDFFLRYMRAKYPDSRPDAPDVLPGRAPFCISRIPHACAYDDDWLGNDDEPLEGFSWRGGSERDTTGIIMWSKIFLATLPTKQEVAVILMDTQGTFDSESTVRDCATVFALSTMLSSIQIYNLSQNIQEDDLQHLHLFTEYGRLALEESCGSPFQKLQFLVRDWSFPYEAPYGFDGGEVMLERRLQISENQHPELQSLRKHIRTCFSEISCFLMPHPGLRVATNPSFDGRLSDIEEEFKQHLLDFVPMLLAPENLILKRISGQYVKAKELLQYFHSYVKIYSGDELPEPKSMLVATAEANNLAAVAAAKETYYNMMENVCGGARPYLSSNHLESEHTEIKEMVVDQFDKKRKMGGQEFSVIYRDKLLTDLDDLYLQFIQHNESKNIFKSARTPATLFAIAAIFYVLSGVFGMVGLYIFANLCNIATGFSVFTMILWFYVRYSGELNDFGDRIDEGTGLLWENVIKPTYQQCLEKGLERAVSNTTLSSMDSRLFYHNGKMKES